MDRYQRVEKLRAEQPILENEIRITSQGRMRNYITYAMGLLEEEGSSEIVFKAMGRAINETVTIVELIKRRIIGLHQITYLGSTDITDTWEPLEEGLLPYQPPLPADQVKASSEFEYEGDGMPTGRSRGSGGRARERGRGRSRVVSDEYEAKEFDGSHDYPRARWRGRGRGGNYHGHGRRGYNNGTYMDTPQDVVGYNHEPSTQGRGRGRGRGPRTKGRVFRSNGPVLAVADGA